MPPPQPETAPILVQLLRGRPKCSQPTRVSQLQPKVRTAAQALSQEHEDLQPPPAQLSMVHGKDTDLENGGQENRGRAHGRSLRAGVLNQNDFFSRVRGLGSVGYWSSCVRIWSKAARTTCRASIRSVNSEATRGLPSSPAHVSGIGKWR